MKSPKSGILCAATGLLAIASTSFAESYRSDLGLGFISGETCLGTNGYTPPDDYVIPTDPPPTGNPPTSEPPPTELPSESVDCVDDYDGVRISGEVFLGDVDTSRGPLALAPFLSRATSVGGSYGRLKTDATDTDIDSWELFGRMVTDSGIVLEAGYGNTEFDSDFSAADTDYWRVAGGYYLAQDTQLRLGYTDADDDFATSERWAIDVTHVQQMENGMTWSINALYGWVTGEAAGGDDDGSDVFLSGQWFFRDDLSVGTDLELIDRDITGDLFAYALHGTWFATDKISFNLSFRSEDFDDLDADTKTFAVEARYRF